MPNLEIHSEAAAELEAAILWYEERRPGLGGLLLEAVERCLDRIMANPLVCPPYQEGCRSCVLRRFPFAIVYACNGQTVRVIAVMHLRRRPGYWLHRSGT